MNNVICYLIINRIQHLPRLAIESALLETDVDIYIGYLNHADLVDIPNHERIHLVDLSGDAGELDLPTSTTGYVSFDFDAFFSLVQLKWSLFKHILGDSKIEFVTYVDLDVVVLRDFTTEFSKAFQNNPELEVLIQNFTTKPSEPRLCMGIFAFRNDSFTLDLVSTSALKHREKLKEIARYGDDDVITDAYMELSTKESFGLLPQQSFPVGNMMNLYLPFGALPGLRPPMPYIFHANFVVGNNKKALLLRLILTIQRKRISVSLIHSYLRVICNASTSFTRRAGRKVFGLFSK